MPFSRFGLAVLSILPFLTIAILIENFAENLGAVGSMLLVTMIPSFFASICLFFLVDWLNVKIGLLKMMNTNSLSILLLTHSAESSSTFNKSKDF